MGVNKQNVKIHVEHLKKNFGNLEVLRDVSTDIYEGEVVVILGPSGSGKSTFLRCLNRLEEITGGTVIVDGHDLTDKKTDLNKVRENVGMVFQHFNLFNNLNVMGNMTLAPVELKKATKGEAKEKALHLLNRVGLSDKAEAYPAQLSGGQKQRIAIARALATDPKVLLCDEATSALDPNTTHAILQLIQKINRELGITVVIITHQMSVVEEVCNRVAILDNGTVVEEGEVQAIFSHPTSKAARRLVYPAGAPQAEVLPGHKLVRVAFGGTQTTDKPLVASLAIECGALVSIMAADTRIVNGQTLGSMLLALPDDDKAEAAIEYIKNYPGITYEEVNG